MGDVELFPHPYVSGCYNPPLSRPKSSLTLSRQTDKRSTQAGNVTQVESPHSSSVEPCSKTNCVGLTPNTILSTLGHTCACSIFLWTRPTRPGLKGLLLVDWLPPHIIIPTTHLMGDVRLFPHSHVGVVLQSTPLKTRAVPDPVTSHGQKIHTSI